MRPESRLLIAGLLLSAAPLWAQAVAPAVQAPPVQASPVQVQPPAPDPQATAPLPVPPPAPVDDARVAQGLQLAQSGDCKGALAILDVAAPTLEGDRRKLIDTVRLGCLGNAGRLDEAAALQVALAKASPTDSTIRGYGILIAADQHRFADVADLIVAAADDRRVLAVVPGQLWTATDAALRTAGDYGRRDRAAIALARSDWRPNDKPGVRDAVVFNAVGALARAGKPDDASVLLNEVDEPPALVSLAIDRKYAALWPAVQEKLGPGQAKAIDAYAGPALARWAGAPTDPSARRDAILAYQLLGRQEDAAALGGQVAIGPDMAEEDVSSVQQGAQALQALKRIDQAAAQLKALGAVDLVARPQAAVAMVTLPEMLDEAGRPAEALAEARAVLGKGARVLSPFGRAWVQRTEVCTLSTLGRAAEAKPIADALRDAPGDNPAAAIEALLCAKRDAEAETLAVKMLATAGGADRIADQFQPSGAIGAPPSRLREQWQRLLTRPAVKTAFEKSARVLPRSLWPSRAERPVPRTSLSVGPTT